MFRKTINFWRRFSFKQLYYNILVKVYHAQNCLESGETCYFRKIKHRLWTADLAKIGIHDLGPIYMVSGARDWPSLRVTLDELTFPCVVVKFKQPLKWISPSCLGGRDNSGRRVVSPRCHEMPRLRVLKSRNLCKENIYDKICKN